MADAGESLSRAVGGQGEAEVVGAVNAMEPLPGRARDRAGERVLDERAGVRSEDPERGAEGFGLGAGLEAGLRQGLLRELDSFRESVLRQDPSQHQWADRPADE